jgi:RNA polymerase sigma factor (sigma-70 family)
MSDRHASSADPSGSKPDSTRSRPTAVKHGNDAALLERWRVGDTTAANELIARQFPRMKRFFGRKTNDRSVIEELVQRTFDRCIQRIETFEQRSSFDTYIYGIARYVLLEYYREQRRANLHTTVEATPVEQLDPEPFIAVETKRERKVLINALRRLPVDSQILVELYFVENLKGPEVREILGLTEGALRGRVRAVRRELKKHIADFASSPELLKSTLMSIETWAKNVREEHEKK